MRLFSSWLGYRGFLNGGKDIHGATAARGAEETTHLTRNAQQVKSTFGAGKDERLLTMRQRGPFHAPNRSEGIREGESSHQATPRHFTKQAEAYQIIIDASRILVIPKECGRILIDRN